jgi:hypothetical protein
MPCGKHTHGPPVSPALMSAAQIERDGVMAGTAL